MASIFRDEEYGKQETAMKQVAICNGEEKNAWLLRGSNRGSSV
jgi:hypothetical protein